MFECAHCLQRAVIWDCDYSFDDYGYDGDGIVQTFHCNYCGANIEYYIRFEEDEVNVDSESRQ